MVTIKLQLRKGSNADGTQTLQFRVTKDRKSKYHTLFKINPKYYNADKENIRKSQPKSKELNEQIMKEKSFFLSKINSLIKLGQPFTVEDIFSNGLSKMDLAFYFKKHTDHLEITGKWQAVNKYNNVLNKIKNSDLSLDFKHIDKKWLEKFMSAMRKDVNINSETTVVKNVKLLKTILRTAQFEKVEINNQVLYYKLSSPKTYKERLNEEELKSFTSVTNKKLQWAKDTFLLQTYTRGTRIGDALKLRRSNIKNNRLTFIEHKTKKEKSLEIIPQIQEIIDRYLAVSNYDYILPWLKLDPDAKIDPQKLQKKIESKTAMINKELKLIAAVAGIDKKITSHIARHTVASLALSKGVDSGDIMDLMNHSSVRVTEAYLKSLNQEKDIDIIASTLFSI